MICMKIIEKKIWPDMYDKDIELFLDYLDESRLNREDVREKFLPNSRPEEQEKQGLVADALFWRCRMGDAKWNSYNKVPWRRH